MKGAKNSTKFLNRECPCGKNFRFPVWLEARKKFCNKVCFYKFRTRPSGLVYVLKAINRAWFNKGNKPWSAGKKLHYDIWNKGKGVGYVNYQGYKILCINGEEILEHRKVVEDYLGRKLKAKEIIHHIDHNKLNNSLDNLMILTRSEHSTLHNQLRRSCA